MLELEPDVGRFFVCLFVCNKKMRNGSSCAALWWRVGRRNSMRAGEEEKAVKSCPAIKMPAKVKTVVGRREKKSLLCDLTADLSYTSFRTAVPFLGQTSGIFK